MSAAPARVLMVGPALEAPGGMSAVVDSYRRGGLFEAQAVRYIASYERPGLARQLPVMARALAQFLLALLAGQVRLVHVHSASRGSFWRKGLFCALAALARTPYIFHLHSGEFAPFFERECGPLRRAAVRWVLRRAAVVLVLTPSWRQLIERVEPRARVEVMPNPVECPPAAALAPLRTPARRLLFLGRLRQKKGVFDLVRALADCGAAGAGLHVTLAGDGELAAVGALARELGVDDRVSLPGWVDGAAKDELLAEADGLVLPSYFEGLPICILEAMAAGVPVLASAVGGIPDTLEQGRCGLLVEAGDVGALRDALLRLANDGPLRAELRQRGRDKIAAEFALPVVLARLAGIYAAARNA